MIKKSVGLRMTKFNISSKLILTNYKLPLTLIFKNTSMF